MFRIKIDSILNKLENVKVRGSDSWMASCPCGDNHMAGDVHQSLSVSIGEDGRILLYCFGGCGIHEICDSMGITTADLFTDDRENSYSPEAESLQMQIMNYAKKNNLEYITTYDYSYGEYKDGLRKIRFKDSSGAKTFRWVHPDPDHHGKYVWSHADLQHRLYVAGDLRKDDTVLVVEGEKDAESARRLFSIFDITAVSAENGASAGSINGKWLDSYSRQLAGKTVYILADNDEVGRKFALAEAANISPFAESVYIIDITEAWPECPAKGDISDMAAQLGIAETQDRIRSLMRTAAPYVAGEAADITGDPWDLFLRKIQTEAYKPFKTGLSFFDDLLGGGVMPQSLILLMAAPGIGKTALCQQVAEEMAARGNDIIFLNLEMSTEQMQARALSYWMSKDKKYYTIRQILQGFNWHDTQRQDIAEAVQSYKRRSAPYIKYNPAQMGNCIESIGNYLNEIGEAAIIDGKKAPAVIIDYLHLIQSNTEKDVAEILKKASYELKQYAVRYNTFVIAISATNRTSNDTGRICLSSGRDSSNLEYTADYVLSLNYADLEVGARSATNPIDMEQLQKQEHRSLVLRALKSRLSAPGIRAEIMFDAAHCIFYAKDEYEQIGLPSTGSFFQKSSRR